MFVLFAGQLTTTLFVFSCDVFIVVVFVLFIGQLTTTLFVFSCDVFIVVVFVLFIGQLTTTLFVFSCDVFIVVVFVLFIGQLTTTLLKQMHALSPQVFRTNVSRLPYAFQVSSSTVSLFSSPVSTLAKLLRETKHTKCLDN